MRSAVGHTPPIWRASFPLIAQSDILYLDNAATTQKPQCVLDAIMGYYQHSNANVHRAAHSLANQATELFEASRSKVVRFLGAASMEEVIFTKGTTESINLVASSWAAQHLVSRKNSEKAQGIAISPLSHHANFVPWHWLHTQQQVPLYRIEVDASGIIVVEALERLLRQHKIGLIAVEHASNALGVCQPIEAICQVAHQAGSKVLVDGAQAVALMPVHVQQLGADFYCTSAHKMYGPMGIGALYVKRAVLEEMVPYQGGGEMVGQVHWGEVTYNTLPYRFEAGTPNVAGVVGWGAAIDFLNQCGWEALQAHENALTTALVAGLCGIDRVTLFGHPEQRVSLASFVVEGAHTLDIGQWLDAKGIAIRTGHHCAQPLMDFLGVDGTARVSLGCYNTIEEVNIFIEKLSSIIDIF